MSEPTAADLWEWLAECITCGRAHRWLDGRGWASPEDGHAYRQRCTVSPDVRAAWDDINTDVPIEEFLRQRFENDEAWINSYGADDIHPGPVRMARLRADLAAKRKLLADAVAVPTISMRHVLRVLATAYADVDGYDKAWRLPDA